ncbi:MAG: FAD-dependent oxidoreductase [Deltaproteobacteria bacterium]|nr:FAD-dependent oxidoreductase [Deltaproteobacteria bacterium]
MLPISSVDAVVVGAGSSGAATAAFLAERGAQVLLVDRRPLARAGACWVNGVPAALLREAGVVLAAPGDARAELRSAPITTHLIAGKARVVITDHDVLEIDMRHLVARLHDRARQAGVHLVDGVTVHAVTDRGVDTSAGPVAARWVIDASGVAGARLLDQPVVERRDLCAAAQEVRHVLDPAAARAFFAAHQVPEDEVMTLTGVLGGYSIINVRLHHDAREVSVLTGTIPDGVRRGGKALLNQFVAQQPWIGARIFGGAGAIPLRRAYDRIAHGKVALVGDAACQVFPGHGSGVGSGLVAARLLADTLTRGDDLRAYEHAWHRRAGGLHAAFGVIRRWNQELRIEQLERLMASGFLDPDLSSAGLDQRQPRVSPRAVLRKARILAGEPALGLALASTVVRASAVRALYARYPRSARAMPAWGRMVAAVVGERPDPPIAA